MSFYEKQHVSEQKDNHKFHVYIYKVNYFTSFHIFTQNLPMVILYLEDGSLTLQKIAIYMVTAIRTSNLIYITNYGGDVWNKTKK